MNIRKAVGLAQEELRKNGLYGWNVKLINSKHKLGVCLHRQQLICLSKNYTAVNEEHRVMNTILHEVAHALVGFNHGHDDVWRMKAIEIGCDGKRCADASDAIPLVIPTAKYEVFCPSCKIIVGYRDRLSAQHSRSFHRQCNRGNYGNRVYIQWRVTGTESVVAVKPFAVVAPQPHFEKTKVIKGVTLSYKEVDGRFVGKYSMGPFDYAVDAKTYESLVSSVYHKIQKIESKMA